MDDRNENLHAKFYVRNSTENMTWRPRRRWKNDISKLRNVEIRINSNVFAIIVSRNSICKFILSSCASIYGTLFPSSNITLSL